MELIRDEVDYSAYLAEPEASQKVRPASDWLQDLITRLTAGEETAGARLPWPKTHELLRLRRNLGRDDLKLLFNINAEFADTLDRRPIELRARSAVFSSLADGILVSGALTGQGVNTSDLQRVVEALEGKVPVFANTGVRIDTVAEILKHADGCVVGTHFKQGGDTWAPVDGERAARFMDHVRTLR